MSFPFPKLLAFLEDEKDQVEFMKVAAEAGIGGGDPELAKILVALQIYSAIYAKIPRQIKSVHEEALAEMRRIRDEAEFISNRASSDAVQIGNWAEQIHKSLHEAEPKKIAAQVHKRLMEDTLALLGGSLQALGNASRQLDVAAKTLDESAYRAATYVEYWQAVSLRRVWAAAFLFSVIIVGLLLAVLWFVFVRT